METMDAMLENVSLEAARGTQVSFRQRVAKRLDAIRWALTLNRTRISLSELTDEQLNDIGLSRHEADAECRKIGLF
jgi:uncharacterized protein YjiS (DUF1127 family)